MRGNYRAFVVFIVKSIERRSDTVIVATCFPLNSFNYSKNTLAKFTKHAEKTFKIESPTQNRVTSTTSLSYLVTFCSEQQIIDIHFSREKKLLYKPHHHTHQVNNNSIIIFEMEDLLQFKKLFCTKFIKIIIKSLLKRFVASRME